MCTEYTYRMYIKYLLTDFSDYKKKMNYYLRSDVTHLSEKDIQDIISAKNSMKRASEVMTNKYKISSQWVYQIWRGVHLPIDPKEMVLYPLIDSPLDSKKMVSTNADSFYREKTDPHKSSSTIIPENKAKKTGERNIKAKSVHISESLDVIP